MLKTEEQLKRSIHICVIHLNRMNDAYNECENILPITENNFYSLTKIHTAFIDQYIFRFAKLQDAIGDKLFRYILMYQDEPIEKMSFKDILNRLEKLAVIENIEHWNLLREVRNDVSHEYPVESDEAIAALNKLFELKYLLENIFYQCINFLKTKGFEPVL